jgi:hypothetical protein
MIKQTLRLILGTVVVLTVLLLVARRVAAPRRAPAAAAPSADELAAAAARQFITARDPAAVVHEFRRARAAGALVLVMDVESRTAPGGRWVFRFDDRAGLVHASAAGAVMFER